NKKVAVTVKKGKVYFDIQKLKKGNSLEFKTVTAVATIYGTAGFVGSVEGQTVASLKEGRLSVTSETNETAEITESQTVIVNKSGQTKSLKLKSSGTKALAFALDSMAATGGDIAEDESSLQKALESFDNVYAQKQADFEKNTYFHWDETNPDTVYTPGVTLTAKATAGITVTILGESSTVGQDGLYSYTSAWGETEYGVKRFLVNCSNGEVEYQCGMRNVLYVQPKVEEPAADSVVTDSIPQDSLVMQDTAAAETKEEAKTETPEPLNLKVSIDGKAVERIHNPFGSNPRAKGYRGNAYNGYLKIKLSGLAEEQLSEIVNVKVLKNGNEVFSKGSEVIKPPEKTSFSIPIVVNVNTVAEFQVVVRLKNGKSVKSNKKKYEVYCNTRSHDPNDLTRYNGGPVTNKKQEYESVSKELKRE
ncbi:MAG: hypothetical protein HUK20_04485, partial [Fibrobacter sp.]|nr:hypothetical protein [Fibrobacter sp.]